MDEYIRKQDSVALWNKYHPYIATKAVEYDDALKSLKPANVAPVVHGRWIKYTGMGKEQWMCSECSAEEKNPKIARYCYYCGAKMDGKE